MTFSKASAAFRDATGHAPSRTTYSRWIRSGVEVNGRVVRLSARRVGKLWLVDRDAIAAFLAELAA